MTDILLRIRENNRFIVRGGFYDVRSGRFVVQAMKGETVTPQINLSDWLGDETISSVTLSTEGSGTVTQSSTSGIITLTASAVEGCADIKITITTSGGRVRIEKVRFIEPDFQGRDDYGTRISA